MKRLEQIECMIALSKKLDGPKLISFFSAYTKPKWNLASQALLIFGLFEKLTDKELAHYLDQTHNNATPRRRSLQIDGYVTEEPDEDGRFHLTSTGAAMVGRHVKSRSAAGSADGLQANRRARELAIQPTLFPEPPR